MKVHINGNVEELEGVTSIDALITYLHLDPGKVAVERNREIVIPSEYSNTQLNDNDELEIVHFIGGGWLMSKQNDPLILGDRQFQSRLLVGTGKYKNFEETQNAIEASGAEIVTVAVRRVNLADRNAPMLQDYIDPKHYTYLPNSAGCYNADEALRMLRLARIAGGWNLVKLEVMQDAVNLMPNMAETFEAAQKLVDDGFEVMVYCSDDLDDAKRLQDIGCTAIMPLAAPIGSGLGIRYPDKITAIIDAMDVPVLVDAGIGTASDATIAMELGCDAVLLNSAIAAAKDPIAMARAMKHAVKAGRLAYKAGRMPKLETGAIASSPITGTLHASS